MLKISFRQKIWTLIAFCALTGSTSLHSSLEIPFLGSHESSVWTRLSHTEGKGLGYPKGYTSLDLFLAQSFFENQLTPFVDLRGHVFNNGRFATNAGLGLRWFDACSSRIWGVNCYYDSFITKRLPYHQISLGLEALGETWDARINGYLPVGHRNTPIYTLSYDFSLGFLTTAREQFAMKGIDAEIGYHFCEMQYFNLYTGLSPYFYWGRSQKTKNAFRAKRKDAIGGRLRTSAVFMTYCELEAAAGYDSLFRWTGQATLSLKIPFDFTCFGEVVDSCTPCWLKERLYQPVKRNEIIVIDRISRFSSNPEILDPEFEP